MLPALFSSLALAPAAVLAALEVDFTSTDSIKQAAAEVAEDLLTYYKGDEPGQTVGILPGPPPAGPYYWWEAGAMFGTLLDFWHWTGNASYNDVVYDGVLAQAGPQRDFKDDNWTASLGNDDQSFWAMTALIAAEDKFRNPPAGEAQWLALAQAVWNEQTAASLRGPQCGGGLEWQSSPFNTGWGYKNTIANGCFFNIGARLARYTTNETYEKWANDTWDWLVGVKYIQGDKDYTVYDGGHIDDNCTSLNTQQFSYNNAVLLLGAATMYNYTNGSQVWGDRVDALLTGIERVFFPKGVAYEPACEPTSACTADMLSFKGYLHRWMASSTLYVPGIRERVMATLLTSTKAAVAQCTGGANGRQCGFHWQSGTYDGVTGAGQEMNVLGALSSLLIHDAAAPVTNATGGTSVGNPDAGQGSTTKKQTKYTAGDRAGAAFLTIFFLGSATAGLVWVMWE
ncbi:glycoside hydrolase family 76 protein [Xylariaceae sp. FL0804]|nr:glycoside hydrolase family 76 protein [Xylariaceae sp. FL0804]